MGFYVKYSMECLYHMVKNMQKLPRSLYGISMEFDKSGPM